jgi:hypothetical protein
VLLVGTQTPVALGAWPVGQVTAPVPDVGGVCGVTHVPDTGLNTCGAVHVVVAVALTHAFAVESNFIPVGHDDTVVVGGVMHPPNWLKICPVGQAVAELVGAQTPLEFIANPVGQVMVVEAVQFGGVPV